MKYFRQISWPIILLIMAAVTLIELVITVFFANSLATFLAIFIFNLFLTVFAILQNQTYALRRTELIRSINEQSQNSLNSVLKELPFGVIRYDGITSAPLWYNPYVDIIFQESEDSLDAAWIGKILKKAEESRDATVSVAEKNYDIQIDQEKNLLYLLDATAELAARDRLSSGRPVIGLLSVDNYDDASHSEADSERAGLNSFITTFLEKNFAKTYNIYLRRLASDRFIFFANFQSLSKMIEDKFDIIEKFQQSAQEEEWPISLSLGASYGFTDFAKIGKTALNNLDLALVRGGAQAVVKEDLDQIRPSYYGGASEARVQKSRTRARAISTALRTIVFEADKVFIVGHRFPDMDALGAAVAMKSFVSKNGKEAFVVYDPSQLLPDVKRAIDKLNESEDGYAHILRVETAQKEVSENSLLIMVDHSKISQTLNQKFFESFEKVVIVDHHRRDDDFPEKAILSYIESSASSATELSIEILRFLDSRHQQMSSIEASVALAGIFVDTKNFTVGTTPRTFEAASYLHAQGADNDLIRYLLATSFADYMKVNELIMRSVLFDEHIAISSGPETEKFDNETIARAADSLLDMEGITASFAIAEHEKGYVAVSARSRKDVNVQAIMEKMGGGGHFTKAATQIEGKTVEEVTKELMEILKER